mmetsp:Transcript_27753/g.44466  ORF Transcript_27753/g.44466 Transcript_27753/m.44466 type:complete len:222 (+) Transcript_27753:940-1605(+)
MAPRLAREMPPITSSEVPASRLAKAAKLKVYAETKVNARKMKKKSRSTMNQKTTPPLNMLAISPMPNFSDSFFPVTPLVKLLSPAVVVACVCRRPSDSFIERCGWKLCMCARALFRSGGKYFFRLMVHLPGDPTPSLCFDTSLEVRPVEVGERDMSFSLVDDAMALNCLAKLSLMRLSLTLLCAEPRSNPPFAMVAPAVPGKFRGSVGTRRGKRPSDVVVV